eukprot:8272181-Ditylum_brightwellii.AAC.1
MGKFKGVLVIHGAQVYHTFGCPLYALGYRLQIGSDSIPKWNPRSRLGIYLGPSPRYARNVLLALSLETGLVSLQFHVIHDDFFETMRTAVEKPPVISKWKILSDIRQSSNVLYQSIARSTRTQRSTRQQLMPFSES